MATLLRRWGADAAARLQAMAVDAVLLMLLGLMAEFLALSFSGRRGPTGMLLTPGEALDLLHYGWWALAAVTAGALWQLAGREAWASPATALMMGAAEDDRHLAWTRTLRGWLRYSMSPYRRSLIPWLR